MFTLNIELGNAAMMSTEDVADALEILVDRLRYESEASGVIRDYNGNKVGRWEVV